MKVRMIEQPNGLLNGEPWPEAGSTADLPDVVAEDMIASGRAEKVAPAAKKTAAAKPDPAEKRPAATDKVETRKAPAKKAAKKAPAKKA